MVATVIAEILYKLLKRLIGACVAGEGPCDLKIINSHLLMPHLLFLYGKIKYFIEV